MLFSLLKHYLDTDTALKLSQSVYCFTTSISHGVDNYFPRLWGTGISNAIFIYISSIVKLNVAALCKYVRLQPHLRMFNVYNFKNIIKLFKLNIMVIF